MEMMMEVNVELLWRRTVPRTPIMRPKMGFLSRLSLLLKKSPEKRNYIVQVRFIFTKVISRIPAVCPTRSWKPVDSRSREQMKK